jgi:hypothetical protein
MATCAEGMDGNLEAVQASNETKLGILGRSVRLLQLYAYHVEITCADILERMWRQSLRPKGLRWGRQRWNVSTVYSDASVRISANKLTPAENVECRRPTMCVSPSLGSSWNSSVQDSHCLILEEQHVVFRRGHQSIEMCWPGFSFRLVHVENASLPNEN